MWFINIFMFILYYGDNGINEPLKNMIPEELYDLMVYYQNKTLIIRNSYNLEEYLGENGFIFTRAVDNNHEMELLKDHLKKYKYLFTSNEPIDEDNKDYIQFVLIAYSWIRAIINHPTEIDITDEFDDAMSIVVLEDILTEENMMRKYHKYRRINYT